MPFAAPSSFVAGAVLGLEPAAVAVVVVDFALPAAVQPEDAEGDLQDALDQLDLVTLGIVLESYQVIH